MSLSSGVGRSRGRGRGRGLRVLFLVVALGAVLMVVVLDALKILTTIWVVLLL
jgi:hypothetical protein